MAALGFHAVASGDIIKDKEPAVIEVQYLKTWMADTLTGKTNSEPMILRIGETSSMFYPAKRMWCDSLKRTDYDTWERAYYAANPIGGGKPYTPLGGLETEYLFRNVMDGETNVYDNIAGDLWTYTEPTESPEWELGSETKKILGYDCQSATCDFRGRKWTAWFAPDIPANEGPWKLFGLPGLVLEASDANGQYIYQAERISTKNLGPVGLRLYVKEEPSKAKSRQEFLQKKYKQTILRKYTTAMSRMYSNKPVKKKKPVQKDFQERDYPHE